MINIVLLALIDLVNYQVPLLRRMAVTHALTAVLASLLMLLAVIFIIADIPATIGWVGLDSLLIIEVKQSFEIVDEDKPGLLIVVVMQVLT